MASARRFLCIAGFALAAISVVLGTPQTKAQVVISNEQFYDSTFVVDEKSATARCDQPGCAAETPILKSIPVKCPGGDGDTCTLHIFFDAKVTVLLPCGGQGCAGTSGATNSYRFLVDGVAPTPGPTGEHGEYVFGKNVISDTDYPARQTYTGSVVAQLKNVGSRDHEIAISLRCVDTLKFHGCGLVASHSTLRVDVFIP